MSDLWARALSEWDRERNSALASNAACGMPCQVPRSTISAQATRDAAGVAPRPRGFRLVAGLAHFLRGKGLSDYFFSADLHAVEVSCRGQYDR
jgi:hypothetical protein